MLFDQRKKLRRITKDEGTDYQKEILEIEDKISRITNWRKADKIWSKLQEVAESDNSDSIQAMWKWKKQLFPKIRPSPPMGVKDNTGNVRTSGSEITDIYEREFQHRLRARPYIPELQDIEIIQSQLFEKRLHSASQITSPPWTMAELDIVLSSLKSGKSRDPSGLTCDLFKKEICGADLK
jgi:hypothetical protein